MGKSLAKHQSKLGSLPLDTWYHAFCRMRDSIFERKYWVLIVIFVWPSCNREAKRSTLVVMAQLRAQEFVSNRDFVSEFIKKSFMARGVAEQRLIIQQNRPQPKLDIRSHGRTFRQQWYEKKDWLCGSEVRQGLFCWPCLLFKPGVSSTWTLVGYKNM